MRNLVILTFTTFIGQGYVSQKSHTPIVATKGLYDLRKLPMILGNHVYLCLTHNIGNTNLKYHLTTPVHLDVQ